MIFKYRIVKNFTPNDRMLLDKMGISVKIGWDDFEIDDSNIENIIELKKYFGNEWRSIAEHIVLFSSKDLSQCDYLNIMANKMLGYAKPDVEKEADNFEYPFDIYPYYKDVFEVLDTDEEYGVLRGKQIGNYRLDGQPKWGRTNIGSAHYIEDAFFTKLETYEKVFKPLNIECRAVINYKTKQPIDNVVQIMQQGISESPLVISEEYCKEISFIKKWSLKKYALRNDVPHPLFQMNPGKYDFFYTQEFFGSGGFTQRNSIISQKLFKILCENKLTGLNYLPVMKK